MSEFVSETAPFLLNQRSEALDSPIERIQLNHCQRSQLKHESMKRGIKRSAKPEQFYPIHQNNELEQTSSSTPLL